MTRIAISAGHGLHIRGASSAMMDEVDEARRVVTRVTELLMERGVDVKSYWDDVSTTQQENLARITQWHNSLDPPPDLNVSVHFNAFEQCDEPRGTECYYITQSNTASRIAEAIADAGFINRGPKYNSGLYFLRETAAPSVLIEVCFVDSVADCEVYFSHFDLICENLADLATTEDLEHPQGDPMFEASGACSFFGGPEDTGVDPDEGLAFISDVSDAPQLFLPYQPDGTTGLARRLNPFVHYIACRWDYDVTEREMLLSKQALVTAKKTGISLTAFPADWGPHQDTGRIADLSPSLMADLGISTDDDVDVQFPFEVPT